MLALPILVGTLANILALPGYAVSDVAHGRRGLALRFNVLYVSDTYLYPTYYILIVSLLSVTHTYAQRTLCLLSV